MGIILEDDCDPSDSFFTFCKELLIKYENTEEIKMISGNFYYEKLVVNKDNDNSYFFSRRPGTHGWATWRRAWKKFDPNGARISLVVFYGYSCFLISIL